MKFYYQRFDYNELKQQLENDELEEVFRYLLMRTGDNIDKIFELMQDLQKQGYINSELDIESFRRNLEENGRVHYNFRENRHEITSKEKRLLRERVFNEIFQKLKRSGKGNHAASLGHGNLDERLAETRSYRFGDDLNAININDSFFNTIKRTGNLDLGSSLSEEDFAVYEQEQTTHCATTLLIDISHSMILYGEDRITPAKQVALSLSHLILTQYPKDDLNVVVFGNDAKQIPLDEIASISVGPYHTNTQMGLRLARNILLKKKHLNKQIIMITDGKPTVITEPNGTNYKNSFGLDPKIVNKTLNEAILCRKNDIVITTFMLTSEPILRDFISQLTELNRGRAFYASLNDLGKFMMENFVTNRKKNI